jgi:hypothetical protein
MASYIASLSLLRFSPTRSTSGSFVALKKLFFAKPSVHGRQCLTAFFSKFLEQKKPKVFFLGESRNSNSENNVAYKLVVQLTAAALVMFVISGCTTLADVKTAKGTGEKGTYSAAYDDVWLTVVSYINESALDLISEDKAEGTILAQRGVNLANYGDNVAVFINSIGDDVTAVEAVHKKAMETNILGAWWDQRIIKHLNEVYK